MSSRLQREIQVAVFDRAAMLNGQPAGAVSFGKRVSQDDFRKGLNQIFMPSDLDGSIAPPLGSPNFFYRPHDDAPGNDRIELWQLHVDWSNPNDSMFAGPTNIRLAEFDIHDCGGIGACVPQPNTAVKLDNLHHKPMWRLQYRNFQTHETLVGNFTVDVDGNRNHGIRWFELRRSGDSGWVLHQEGTHAPQPSGTTCPPPSDCFVHRWLGSIAMDRFGNIALGYSVSNATDIFPSIRYAGQASTDLLDLLPQSEKTIQDGRRNTPGLPDAGAQDWGDYSSLNVDPADDCTFWYTNTYVTADGQRQTRIASFSFRSCEANELRTVNALVSLNDSPIDPAIVAPDARCPAGTVGIFRSNAILRVNNVNPRLHNFVLRVNTLTNGNLLIGDGGVAGGVGTDRTILGTVDRPVPPQDVVSAVVEICLQDADPFTLVLDVLAKDFKP